MWPHLLSVASLGAPLRCWSTFHHRSLSHGFLCRSLRESSRHCSAPSLSRLSPPFTFFKSPPQDATVKQQTCQPSRVHGRDARSATLVSFKVWDRLPCEEHVVHRLCGRPCASPLRTDLQVVVHRDDRFVVGRALVHRCVRVACTKRCRRCRVHERSRAACPCSVPCGHSMSTSRELRGCVCRCRTCCRSAHESWMPGAVAGGHSRTGHSGTTLPALAPSLPVRVCVVGPLVGAARAFCRAASSDHVGFVPTLTCCVSSSLDFEMCYGGGHTSEAYRRLVFFCE